MLSNLSNYISKNTGLLLRLDDICENMNWDHMSQLEDLFIKHKIKPILGVIPNNKDNDLLSYPCNLKFWDKVREWQKIGWEISIHGYSHLYSTETYKKDFFGYGGRSEFFNKPLEDQINLINKAKKKFKDEGIITRSFFAPNHTYDKNTFTALKECGVKIVIDGYGLIPYNEFNLTFIPQLFFKELILPFGVQCTQIHINYLNDRDIDKLKLFINKNYKKTICIDTALNLANNGFVSNFSKIILENLLKILRLKKF